ncbi:hypothetical protein [Streptomyces sp. NPDC088254]|uniref:hypothetical protein n=1 Tax=Streptomyces sp. NPDC088254 TaxID=3365847 RepID=UPI00381485B5
MIASRLAQRFGLSRAGVSKTLGRLERRGFTDGRGLTARRREKATRAPPVGGTREDGLYRRTAEPPIAVRTAW